uniref:Chondroitin proteoglycan 3 n=1 Tax=Panagrellus redivivus TaxID=6233 RepID=A0A7E4W1U9_PANRE
MMLKSLLLICLLAGSVLANPLDTLANSARTIEEVIEAKPEIEASGQEVAVESTETPEILVVDQGPDDKPEVLVLPAEVSASEDAIVEQIIRASDARDYARAEPIDSASNETSTDDDDYPSTEGVAIDYVTIHPVTDKPDPDAPTTTEPSNDTKDSCKASTVCYADKDCGEEGRCLGLFVGKCNCNACLNWVGCSDDSECGGLNGACADETKRCDCIAGFKVNGFPTFIDALRGLCNNKDCDGKVDTCYGLPCTSGRCVC